MAMATAAGDHGKIGDRFPGLREVLAAGSLNSVKSVSPYCRFCKRVRDMAIS